ncbi:sugar kinase [Micromonospora sp. NPDC005206]|uniref:carbohydrate kinase family protein n=1 Tax=Micromonospora sp. NPDC005206 TaxID=3157022 RepID=UPI0033B24164
MVSRVACSGVLILDVLGRPFDAIPTAQNSTFIDEITASVGGTGGITAAALARLGVPTSVGGAVGDDTLGEILLARLASFGVDVSAVAKLDGVATSASILPIRTNGERPALHVPGASLAVTRETLEAPVGNDVRWFHFAGALRMPKVDGGPAAEMLKALRARGTVTSSDVLGTRTPNSGQLLEQVLPHLDYFMPNLAEGQVITGEQTPERVADVLVTRGVGCIVLKLGEDGCLVRTADVEFRVPAAPAKVIDTTGCGDSFSAGFIAARMEGLDLETAARWGSATAGLVIERLGGDSAPITRELVQERLVALTL